MKKIPDSVTNNVINDYMNGLTKCCDIGAKYNLDRHTVSRILKRAGMNVSNGRFTSKYIINESYFDVIDTEEKAYFLGFLYADGCVHTNCNRNRLIMPLAEVDYDILQKLAIAMESNAPILLVDIKSKYPSMQNIRRFAIESKQICDSLITLGCTPRKTFTLKFPTNEQVPEPLIRHFIRGYWDGDGCFSSSLSETKTSFRLCASAASTENFCLGLQNIITNTLKIKSYIYKYKEHRLTTRSIAIGGTQQVYKFISWLYDDSLIYLDRKYNKFIDIKSKLIQTGQIK